MRKFRPRLKTNQSFWRPFRFKPTITLSWKKSTKLTILDKTWRSFGNTGKRKIQTQNAREKWSVAAPLTAKTRYVSPPTQQCEVWRARVHHLCRARTQAPPAQPRYWRTKTAPVCPTCYWPRQNTLFRHEMYTNSQYFFKIDNRIPWYILLPMTKQRFNAYTVAVPKSLRALWKKGRFTLNFKFALNLDRYLLFLWLFFSNEPIRNTGSSALWGKCTLYDQRYVDTRWSVHRIHVVPHKPIAHNYMERVVCKFLSQYIFL